MVRIIGIGGSLDHPSISRQALSVALRGAGDMGAETTIFDVDSLQLPLYSPGGNVPAQANTFATAVHEADGIILSSPLYHGTISGAFKNAIDWLELLHDAAPPYLSNTPVGCISTAGGMQGLEAVHAMANLVRALRGYPVPLVLPVPQIAPLFDPDGTLRDERIRRHLLELGEEVGRAAQQVRETGRCDYAETWHEQVPVESPTTQDAYDAVDESLVETFPASDPATPR